MAIQQHRSKPSIVLTLKVLQIVYQLRRRLKPRSGPSILENRYASAWNLRPLLNSRRVCNTEGFRRNY
ncbi:hypothetical protein DM02DRAFT_617403 [Periconia macrospinosa]|uniref:Uncharacterized protein n=1 Tax=Periconia macrospinosa TaxID=97972 RepID=A0A2V1DDL6_9PLEO|nr:hypothetical protein DM02DRAFT_617403 [Periconia macrospinosa]